MLAPAAGELIGELALAIERGLKLADLASVVHVYPTIALAIQQLAAQASYAKARALPPVRALEGLSAALHRRGESYRPGGWRATNPPEGRSSRVQRVPPRSAEVSKRQPATTM